MAAEDVAKAVGRVAVGAPVNGIVEVGGPEQFPLDAFIQKRLSAGNDPRTIVADARAGYYGVEVDERTLVPGSGALSRDPFRRLAQAAIVARSLIALRASIRENLDPRSQSVLRGRGEAARYPTFLTVMM